MKKRIITAIPLLLMAILIFYYSSKNGEQSTSSSIYVTEQVSNLFQQRLIINLETLNYYIRKMAHLLEYAMFSMLVGIHLMTWNMSKKKLWYRSIIISFLYACTDEFHQYFVPGRRAQIKDVCIDTAGAIIGITVFLGAGLLIHRYRMRKQSL